MNRIECMDAFARQRGEAIVVVGPGFAGHELASAAHTDLTLYNMDMGYALPLFLGLALARPEQRVVALEGDGSLLMQLGSLSTIATLAPKNLTMVVMDNGIYQITGAQPTPAAAVTDIVAIAVASGIASSAWAADEDDFERLIAQSLEAQGPTLIGVRIDDKPGVGTTRRDPVQIRERFMLGLGVRQPL